MSIQYKMKMPLCHPLVYAKNMSIEKALYFDKIYIVNFYNRKRNFKYVETESRVNSKIV